MLYYTNRYNIIYHFSLNGTKLCIILTLKNLASTNLVPHNPHKQNTSKARKRRCMECEGCKREDCGSCINCNDMKKFGGQGKKKQKCMHRTCTQMITTDEGNCLQIKNTSLPQIMLLQTEYKGKQTRSYQTIQAAQWQPYSLHKWNKQD